MLLDIVFWASVIAVVYHHVGYPILLHQLACIARARSRAAAPASAARELPSMTVIVPAHNEASVIAQKIRDLATLDYPRDRLQFVLALDGCTDQTKSRAEEAIKATANGSSFYISEHFPNVGKVGILNSEIAKVGSEIVALSDASASIDAGALLRAARHFADPSVGVACATYSVSEKGSDGERAYWHYQTRIKADEATLAAPMGAHGAFYLIRRSLWSPLPPDTINDDFVLPMTIVARGYRAVYDTGIVASELERTGRRQEFRRRVRIGAGNLQQVIRLVRLGDPRRGWVAFVFLSGKALRGALPLILTAAFFSTAALAAQGHPFYRAVLGAELAALFLAVLAIAGAKDRIPRGLRGLSYMMAGHLASAVGALFLLAGMKNAAWQFSLAGKLSGKGLGPMDTHDGSSDRA